MIKENLVNIKEKISSVCAKNGRNSASLTLVCASKGRSLEDISRVLEAGITDIGENKVNEALLKYNAIRNTRYASQIKWHMLGHLQTNKVREAVKLFDLIHSVDSSRLAEEINKQAAKINKIQDILIEVNTSGENSKFGVKPEELIGLVKLILGLKNIRVLGLMTIAPIVDNPEKTRPYFRMLRELRDTLCELQVMNYEPRILSMGMSDDFEAAIEEGAAIVRIGRGIFEVMR